MGTLTQLDIVLNIFLDLIKDLFNLGYTKKTPISTTIEKKSEKPKCLPKRR
jgi:hypothetical protein